MTNDFHYKIETGNSFLDYKDNIVFVRLKEDVEITVKLMQEQYSKQELLVGNDLYAVLVDASKNANANKETREYMAMYNPQNRVATAILTKNNLSVNMIANFYLRISKPLTPTKIFNKEDDAVIWLKERLAR